MNIGCASIASANILTRQHLERRPQELRGAGICIESHGNELVGNLIEASLEPSMWTLLQNSNERRKYYSLGAGTSLTPWNFTPAQAISSTIDSISNARSVMSVQFYYYALCIS